MQHLMYYREFEIFEDKPWEGYTKYPIAVKYLGHCIESYETVEDARKEIDAHPEWMERAMKRIDNSDNSNDEDGDIQANWHAGVDYDIG